MSRAQLIQPKILYFGTPVVLIGTCNEDLSPNLAPMSSAWALGYSIILGLGTNGKTFENLLRWKECTLNLPSPDLWQAVERLAPLTGKNPVPEAKQAQYRFEPDKFSAAGLTPINSEMVIPPRVSECPLQLEARLIKKIPVGNPQDEITAVEVEVLRVHAHPEIISFGHHIDPLRWSPLIYNFRHYFALGEELGKNFRSQT